MADTTETFELSRAQAEFYENRFVPALFAEWAPRLVDVAGVGPGDTVLDVACGTGVVTRAAAERVGPHGTVVGIDQAPAMIGVAARHLPTADFHVADAEHLPFDDDRFDRVLCQASLMFFPDADAALAEMRRVVTPDGTVAVQVWGRLEASTGFRAFVDVATRHAGSGVTDLLGAYFLHGDLDRLTRRFESVGLTVVSTTTRLGAMRYGSVDEFVTTEVESTPLIDRIDHPTYDRIRADATRALRPFLHIDGLALPIEGHLVAATPT
jgi:ubiquinone/menaquinone biosynthesis C-methylase UbiE